MSYAQLMTHVYTPTNVPALLLKQYGQLRYKCFKPEDPYVTLNHQDKTELDHFDRDNHTLYIMVVAVQDYGQTELMSAVRLRPTLVDYELEMESYQYLTDGITLPKETGVYEGSRWVGRSSRSTEGMLSTAMLVTKLFHLATEMSFREIVGTISTLSENWLAKRQAATKRHSELFHSERDKLDILVSRIQVNEDFLGMAHLLLQSVLRETNLDTISISAPPLRQAA